MDAPTVDIDFLDPSVIRDPFPLYEEVRAAGRVVWNSRLQVWMTPGFDECAEVTTDSGERFAMWYGDQQAIPFFHARNMILVDGGEHKRLRSPLVRSFTPTAVSRWEQRIGDVVDQLLAPLVQGDPSFDLFSNFTLLPAVIIADMLGVPEERYADFRRWSHVISTNIGYGSEGPDRHLILERTGEEINEYLGRELDRHRREDLDDLLSLLLGIPRDTFSEGEIRSTAVILLVAGYDTTAKLLANSLVALERHPEQRRLLVQDPSRIPVAIEEVLRWVGSPQTALRRVVRDTRLAGTELTAGDTIYALLLAANRDPSRWSQPERFDVTREPKSHMGFGFGPHLCIGAPLARLETQVALERLLHAAPHYRLHDLDYGAGFFVRGPERAVIEVVTPSPR